MIYDFGLTKKKRILQYIKTNVFNLIEDILVKRFVICGIILSNVKKKDFSRQKTKEINNIKLE